MYMISRHDLHYQNQVRSGTLAPQQIAAKRELQRQQQQTQNTSYRLTTNKPVQSNTGEWVDPDDARTISYSNTMLKQAEQDSKSDNIIVRNSAKKYTAVNKAASAYETALDLNNNSGNVVLEFAKGVARVPSDTFRLFAAGGYGITLAARTKGVNYAEAGASAVKGTVDFAKENPAQFAGSVTASIVTAKGAGAVSRVGRTVKTGTGKITLTKTTGTAKQTAPTADAAKTTKAKFKITSAGEKSSGRERVTGQTQRLDKLGRVKPEGNYMRLEAGRAKPKREYAREPFANEIKDIEFVKKVESSPFKNLKKDAAQLKILGTRAAMNRKVPRIEGPKTALAVRNRRVFVPKADDTIYVYADAPYYQPRMRLTGETLYPKMTASELKAYKDRAKSYRDTINNLSDYEMVLLNKKYNPPKAKAAPKTGNTRKSNNGNKGPAPEGYEDIRLPNGMVIRQKVQYKAPKAEEKKSSGPKVIVLTMEKPKQKVKTATKTETKTAKATAVSAKPAPAKTTSKTANAALAGQAAQILQNPTKSKTQTAPQRHQGHKPAPAKTISLVKEDVKHDTKHNTKHETKRDVKHDIAEDAGVVLALGKVAKPKEEVKEEPKQMRRQKRSGKVTVKTPPKTKTPKTRKRPKKDKKQEKKSKGKKPSFAIRSEVVNQFAWLEPDTAKKAKPKKIQK